MGNSWNPSKLYNEAMGVGGVSFGLLGSFLAALILFLFDTSPAPPILYACSKNQPNPNNPSGCVAQRGGQYKTKEDCKCWKCPSNITANDLKCEFTNSEGTMSSINACTSNNCSKKWSCQY